MNENEFEIQQVELTRDTIQELVSDLYAVFSEINRFDLWDIHRVSIPANSNLVETFDSQPRFVWLQSPDETAISVSYGHGFSRPDSFVVSHKQLLPYHCPFMQAISFNNATGSAVDFIYVLASND